MPMSVLRDKYRAREERRERVLAFLESVRELILDRESGIEVNWWNPEDQSAPKELAAAVKWEPSSGSACRITFGIQVLGTPEHVLVPVGVVPVRGQRVEAKQERVVIVGGDVSRQHRTIETVADAIIRHAQSLIDAYLEKMW